MISTTFSLDENKLVFYSTYKEYAKIDFILFDLNTSLGAFNWWMSFNNNQYHEWILDSKYINHSSGFNLKGYLKEELVIDEIFQFKEIDNRFKFSNPGNELTYSSWFSLVYDREYDKYGLSFDSNDVVYDLGANVGAYSMWALYNNVKQVYAFEPTPNNISCLIKTFNKYPNIQIFDKAISDKNETCQFFTFPHSVCNSLCYTEGNPINIESINLEDFINQNNLLSPTIIKCDIEGTEYKFINSLSDTFFNSIKFIIIEFHLNSDNKIWSLISKFLNLGFNTSIIGQTNNSMGTLIIKK